MTKEDCEFEAYENILEDGGRSGGGGGGGGGGERGRDVTCSELGYDDPNEEASVSDSESGVFVASSPQLAGTGSLSVGTTT